MRLLAAVGFVGRRGTFVGAVRRAVAMPMRCLGASRRRGVPAGTRGGLGGRYGVVSGDELRRLLRHRADRPDGGWPMRLSLPSVSGQGGLQMKRQGNGYELYPLLT